MCRLLIFAALIGTAFSAGKDGYDYSTGDKGPANWAKLFPTCDAKNNWRQSPVDIRDDRVHYDPSLTVPVLSQAYHGSLPATMYNWGQFVNFQFDRNDDVYATVNVDGSPRKYRLDSGHFHWGAKDKMGSEHTMNGRQFAGEIHLVHYNYDKASVYDALVRPDDLFVMGAFIDMRVDSQPDPYEYTNLFSRFKDIRLPNRDNGTRMSITPTDLLPRRRTYVYNYPGGLTTPNCTGIVQWFVFKEPVYLQKSTIQKNWWDDGPRNDNLEVQGPNWRPVQPLNSRMIRTNKPSTQTNDATSSGRIGVITAFLSLIVTKFL